eukprot:TRINITY_DN28554_c0_g1_i1.p1 TRINITY_DN28554_c0_g1~~TRINITY_DN28554_c0_g1_i1.p1  ORF type:complete len:596 (+),score=55.80 TRINITY_DN28554_c0_g1_i1:71-1858(+)
MADGSTWLVGCSGCAAFLSLLLSCVGLLTPWWTLSEPALHAPTETEVSLWLTNTRFTEVSDGGVTEHQGCDYKCQATRFTRPRVISKCQTWNDIRKWAPDLCTSGFPTRAESLITTTTKMPQVYDPNGVVPDQYTRSIYQPITNVYVNPDSPVEKLGPPAAPINFVVSTYKPNSFGRPTTTSTLLTTITSTSVTTTVPRGLTVAPTPKPGPTTPLLGARFCVEPTLEEIAQAPYTQWELNFDISQEVMERIYAQLNQFFYRAPFYLFAQRPTRYEQVRLVWEVYLQRSPPDKWLGLYPCPSVPARELHEWIWRGSSYWVRELGFQGIEPRQTKVKEWSDWAFKQAWDIEVQDLTTTSLPKLDLRFGTTTTFEALTPPPVQSAPPSPPLKASRDPDVITLTTCQLATYDPRNNADGPFAWYDEFEPCALVSNSEKVWVIQGCLGLAMLIAAVYSFSAGVMFMGSKFRFASRFPAGLGFWLAIAVVVLNIAALLVAGTTEVKPPMNGVGFISTIFSVLVGAVGVVLAKCGEVANTARKKAEAQPAAPKAVVSTLAPHPLALQHTSQVGWAQPQPPRGPELAAHLAASRRSIAWAPPV